MHKITEPVYIKKPYITHGRKPSRRTDLNLCNYYLWGILREGWGQQSTFFAITENNNNNKCQHFKIPLWNKVSWTAGE